MKSQKEISKEISVPSDSLGSEVNLNGGSVPEPAAKTRKLPPIYIKADFNWYTNLIRYENLCPSLKS